MAPHQESATPESFPSTHPLSGPPVLFVLSALSAIIDTKETKRYPELKQSAQEALELLRSLDPSHKSHSEKDGVRGEQPPPRCPPPDLLPRVILPLRQACESKASSLMATSLDCLGKLLSYDVLKDLNGRPRPRNASLGAAVLSHCPSPSHQTPETLPAAPGSPKNEISKPEPVADGQAFPRKSSTMSQSDSGLPGSKTGSSSTSVGESDVIIEEVATSESVERKSAVVTDLEAGENQGIPEVSRAAVASKKSKSVEGAAREPKADQRRDIGTETKQIAEYTESNTQTRGSRVPNTDTSVLQDSLSHSVSPPGSKCVEPMSGQSSTISSQSVDRSFKKSKPLLDSVVETICECHSPDSTDEMVQLRIVQALLSAVTSGNGFLHGQVLLKSIGTTYNIFLVSKSQSVQTVSQGTLTQMVNAVFGRIKKLAVWSSFQSDPITEDAANRSDHLSAKSPTRSHMDWAPGPTPSNGFLESSPRESGVDLQSGHAPGEVQPTSTSFISLFKRTMGCLSTATQEMVEELDLFLRDALLVFRALSNLSLKPSINVPSDGLFELKLPAMRSRIFALHLLLSILNTHQYILCIPFPASDQIATGMSAINVRDPPPSTIELITSEQELLKRRLWADAIRSYLAISMAKSSVSSVPHVLEVGMEMFGKIVSNLRYKFKKELELYFGEVLLTLLEMHSSSFVQKYASLEVLRRVFWDQRALVEVYLNYDCDEEAADNVYERMVNVLCKIIRSRNMQHAFDQTSNLAGGASVGQGERDSETAGMDNIIVPPSLTGSSTLHTQTRLIPSSMRGSPDMVLRGKAIECLSVVLQSMVSWCRRDEHVKDSKSPSPVEAPGGTGTPRHGESADRPIVEDIDNEAWRLRNKTTDSMNGDDPSQFEEMKLRKVVHRDALRKFNDRPKEGVRFMLDHCIIPESDPESIARFLYRTDGLNKAMIGEYLGEGDPEIIAVMHAFVDQMDFTDQQLIEALRKFLQHFRLPGESQKIDRFILKFAERYLRHNPGSFASADAAYVLSYSIIMLNTALHNPQVKRRITVEEFREMGRELEDAKDVSDDYLEGLYNEVLETEIKMKDDPLHGKSSDGAISIPLNVPIAGALVAERRSRRQRREALALASEEMSVKVEALFKGLYESRPTSRGGPFVFASHPEHVRPMFELVWMAVLAALSEPLQDSGDFEVIRMCLDGFRAAIRITCTFNMELQRNAFVTTLSKFTFLNNLGEMKERNVSTVKALLEIALTEGDQLHGNWWDVLSCVSQLERLQLVSGGAMGLDQVEDMRITKPVQHIDNDDNESTSQSEAGAGVAPAVKRSRRISLMGNRGKGAFLPADLAHLQSGSQDFVVATDRIFTNSVNLSGTGIVDFVRSLADVSWSEIQSSGDSDNPRLFSLMRLVEIAYYNMKRIRVEWSNMWAIIGRHFNQVVCHPNKRISFFGVDSLRQLSMKFLEKEELSNFRFQKEFMAPFEYAMKNSKDMLVRDMVVRCFQHMIQAKSDMLRSGWKTCFYVFGACGEESQETLVSLAFESLKWVMQKKLKAVVENNSLGDFLQCTVRFARNSAFPKLNLQAVEILRQTNDALSWAHSDESLVLYWMPVLVSFNDVIVSCELEIRTKALKCLYETLRNEGSTLSTQSWELIASKVLLSTFDKLKQKSDKDELNVWLSTTLIQALRQLIDLFTYHYQILSFMTIDILDLLGLCIVQDNETLARLGTSCLQQLVESNSEQFGDEQWALVCQAFVDLFEQTTAYSLFNCHPERHYPTNVNARYFNSQHFVQAKYQVTTVGGPSKQAAADAAGREFSQVITKCVLQLLLIQTVSELFYLNDALFNAPSIQNLMSLLSCLRKSYQFAKTFNEDQELRGYLLKKGYMKQMPNLLKQETSSALAYVGMLSRVSLEMDAKLSLSDRRDTEEELVWLMHEILKTFDIETKKRAVNAWRPVVITTLNRYAAFPDDKFLAQLPRFHDAICRLFDTEMTPELQQVLSALYRKMGNVAIRSQSP